MSCVNNLNRPVSSSSQKSIKHRSVLLSIIRKRTLVRWWWAPSSRSCQRYTPAGLDMAGPARCSCWQHHNLCKKDSAAKQSCETSIQPHRGATRFMGFMINISLFHNVPRCVHMHDTVHHLAAVAHVMGHAGRVLVLIGMPFGSRWVHCGIWEETECCAASRLRTRSD